MYKTVYHFQQLKAHFLRSAQEKGAHYSERMVWPCGKIVISFILLTLFVIIILYHLNVDLLKTTYIENQLQLFLQNTKENHRKILLLSYSRY